jgi:hypothetical protein
MCAMQHSYGITGTKNTAREPAGPSKRRRFILRMLPSLLILLALVFSTVCFAADMPIGQVTSARGMAAIKRPGAGKDLPAARGADFFVGDIIETAPGASAQVTFTDGSFVNLAPASSIRVNQYAFDETRNRRTVRSRVISGTVRFVAHGPAGPGSLLFVECGRAEITAWSPADFAVIASPGAAEVAILRGGAGVKNTSPLIVGTVSLGVSQRTMVRGNTPPSQPDIITAAERKRYTIMVR